MRTVWLIADREVRQRLRAKLFVWTTIVISVLLTLAALLPVVIGAFRADAPDPAPEDLDPDPTPIVVVGDLGAVERDALEQVLGETELRQVDDEAAAHRLLAAEDPEVEFGVVAGDRVLVPPQTGMVRIVSPLATRAAEALALADALDAADVDLVAEVLDVDPLPVEVVGADDPAEAFGAVIVANIGVVFLFGVLIMYSSMIINGVIEEKGSRVVELLVEAVPVRQLMAGKVLGLGLVGIGQTIVLFAPAVVALSLTAGDLVPTGLGSVAGLVVLWFVLGYGLYSVVAAGLGSLVSRPEEAQAVLTPANLLMIAGYFVGFVAINAPDAAFARVAALIPFSAPYAMLVRQVLGTPSVVEVVVSIVLTLVTIGVLTLLAARLYEGGILRVGARVRLRDAWRHARG